MRRTFRLVALSAAMLLPSLTIAHEFWMEPEDYRIGPDEQIRVRTFNGEKFSGIEYGYSESAYRRSGVVAGNTNMPLPGERGVKPAVQVPPAGPGLNIVYHASPVSTLTYANFIKFERFIKGKRLDWALEQHKANKMPQENIREAYFRFVKALVAVGDGAGSDRSVGMPYELVAQDNPYTTSGDIRVQVLLKGAPAPKVPVFTFHRKDGEVEELFDYSDVNGVFTVPRRGGGDFMVNAVHISEPSDSVRQSTKANWQTLWAALNYRLEN